jgi:hypothetical protein
MLPTARPANAPTYVIPGSHNLDPPYSWVAGAAWPYPRSPNFLESESRAPGTGLIGGVNLDVSIELLPVYSSLYVIPVTDPPKLLPPPIVPAAK